MSDAVAVVVPAFDAAGELAATLDSVLGQTLPPTEVCVTVDGASTDATLEVAQRFEPDVSVVPIDPTTSMAGRQEAVDHTTAELVASCDADDLWLPTKLERQVEALVAHPDLDGTFCQVTEFLVDAASSPSARLRQPHERVDGRVASALLIRRKGLLRSGGFAAADHLAQWIEWLSGALAFGLRFGMVDEVLVRRGLRPDSYTSRHRGDTADLLGTVRAHLEAVRDGDGERR